MKNPIQKHLDETNKSVADFAKEVGVTKPTVYSWINGKYSPTHGTSREIARTMDISRTKFRKLWSQWEKEQEGDEKYRRRR